MSADETCIYCGNNFDSTLGEGDHIIPDQLGEFKNDKRFRRICSVCNNKIGKAEQQIVQSGPEGFFRQIVQPKSKRLLRHGIGHQRGAMGSPPPKYTTDTGGHPALVEPSKDNPQNVFEVDHIFIRDKNGNETHIKLYPNMRPKQIRDAIANAGLGEMKKLYLSCGEKNWEGYTSLLQKIWPNSKFEESEPTSRDVPTPMPCKIKFMVNANYFRSLAKIAFHYYLTHSRRHRGDEDCFGSIRNFIMSGGATDTFFQQKNQNQFVMPFGDLSTGGVATPDQWCHFLAASEANGQAVTYVQLFVGRGCIPTPHYVSLGQWSSRILLPDNEAWAHVYIYDQPQQQGKYAGHVKAAQITRFR